MARALSFRKQARPAPRITRQPPGTWRRSDRTAHLEDRKQSKPPTQFASGYMTDGHGNVRDHRDQAKVPDRRSAHRATPALRIARPARTTGRRLGEYDSRRNSGYIRSRSMRISDSLYVLKKLNGRDALYTGSSSTDRAEQRWSPPTPRSTSTTSCASADGQRVIGYTYADDRGRRRSISIPSSRSSLSRLARHCRKLPLINFEEASADGNEAAGLRRQRHRSRHLLYLRSQDQANWAKSCSVRPALKNGTLAQVKSVTITGARTGRQIPAYLTLPPGAAGKNLPAVVLPHGGPSARDEWGFDWLAQFLAARGYAVIQPNYRGSAGLWRRVAR